MYLARGLAINGSVVDVRVLGGGVVAPDDSVLDLADVNTAALGQLQQRGGYTRMCMEMPRGFQASHRSLIVFPMLFMCILVVVAGATPHAVSVEVQGRV